MEQLGQGLLSLEQDIRGIEYSLIGQQYLGSERDLRPGGSSWGLLYRIR